MLRQAQHERSHGLFTTRKFAFSLVMPLLNRSTGASQNAILTVRLEHHDTPTLPFALSLSKGERETPQLAPIRSYFDGLSTKGVSDFSGTLNGDVNFRSRGDRTREDTDYYVPTVPISSQVTAIV